MKKSNRRVFLKSAGLAAGTLALPSFSITRSAWAAHHKINVAVVGAGGMGRYAVRQGASENLVALCDVDDARAAAAFKEHPQARRFKDFRVMLDKMWKEIDAVAVSTPDHTHFAAAMDAMERGKHVFVQKPLAHNVRQLRALRKAAKHYNVITQMGNQGHTFNGMRRIKEWVGTGVIGEVTEVITWTNRPNAPWFVPPASFPPPSGAAPNTLDWDLWQGPASEREYSPEYVPTRWRGLVGLWLRRFGRHWLSHIRRAVCRLEVGLAEEGGSGASTSAGQGFHSYGIGGDISLSRPRTKASGEAEMVRSRI